MGAFDTGTKTLVVHGQNECDIPTQLPVHEDTQFDALLKVFNHLLVCTLVIGRNVLSLKEKCNYKIVDVFLRDSRNSRTISNNQNALNGKKYK